MNNAAIVLFGISGDLARRKLIPALYRLMAERHIDSFVVIGAAFEDITIEVVLERAKPFIHDLDETTWQSFSARCYYQQLNFKELSDFKKLSDRIQKLEAEYALSGNRLVYFAAAAYFFCTLTQHVVQAGIIEKKSEQNRSWHRVVYEKPFGHDLASAQDINACIDTYLHESQIYRIDHYLTKELVSNIALMRFTNCVLEPLWNSRFIDQVQITLSEKIGLENRGSYYDSYGALCDVVQNHMLELMALVGMEAPEKLAGEYVRNARSAVLEKIKVVDGILGQYEGYSNEVGVAPESTTDTFAALYLTIDNPRWAGVPFYLRTGKFLDKKETIIRIKFKQVDCLLTRHCPSDSNWLTIQISPEALFSLTLNTKKPDRTDEVTPVALTFCHSCVFGPRTQEAYEVLLQEIIRGEQSIAVRFDEIEYAWKVIDAIKQMQLPVYTYAKHSSGPQELVEFSKKHGVRWQL
jgi:glucose-6-phosphate 1-dehydrogenase